MSRRAKVLALVVLLALPTAAADRRPPFHPQQASAWCWAAAGQMIMEHVGPAGDYTQATQAERVVAGCESAPRNTCSATSPVFAGCNRPLFPVFHEFGFDYRETSSPLSWKELKEELDGDRPVLFGWCVPGRCGDTTQTSQGHWMVAVAAEEWPAEPDGTIPMVTVYDPAPSCEGTVRHLTYSTYARGEGGLTFWRNYYRIQPTSRAERSRE